MLPTLWRRPERMLDPFETFFDRAMSPWGNGGDDWSTTIRYPVDMWEDDKHVFIDAEMPGFGKDEIDVTIEQNMLRIKGERKVEKKEEGEKHLHERRYTRVDRALSVPTTVDAEKVDARLDEGVLHVTLNKTPEVVPHKIAIK